MKSIPYWLAIPSLIVTLALGACVHSPMVVPPELAGRSEYLEIDRDKITVLSPASIGPYRTRLLKKRSPGDGLQIGNLDLSKGYLIRYEVRRDDSRWITACGSNDPLELVCQIDAPDGVRWQWRIHKQYTSQPILTGRLTGGDRTIVLEDNTFREGARILSAVDREEMWVATDAGPPLHAVLVTVGYGLWAIAEWRGMEPDDDGL